MLSLAHSAVNEPLRFPLLPSLPLPLLGLYQLTPPMNGNPPTNSDAGFFNANRQPPLPYGASRPQSSQNTYTTPPYGPYGSSQHGTSQSASYSTPQHRTSNANGPPQQHHTPTPSGAALPAASSAHSGADTSHAAGEGSTLDSIGSNGVNTDEARADSAHSMPIFGDTILNLWGFGPKEAQLRQYMHGFIKVRYLHPSTSFILIFFRIRWGKPLANLTLRLELSCSRLHLSS